MSNVKKTNKKHGKKTPGEVVEQGEAPLLGAEKKPDIFIYMQLLRGKKPLSGGMNEESVQSHDRQLAIG